MQYSKLELHIIHVEKLIANCRTNFPNRKMEHIYNNMLHLFDRIKKSDYTNFDSNQLETTKLALDIVFYSVEFLDYKNESDIPKRLIFCLNKLLDEWIPGGTDDYFIVVSYNKSPSEFYVRAAEQDQLRAIKLRLKLLFNIDYSQSLIQISKPRYLANNYLSSTPLYHELGHFIDKNYQIVKILSRELGSTPRETNHFKEFFADLFAAQYIGRSAVAPLDESKTTESNTHPSNALRVEVVNTFIEGTGSPVCMTIINELNRITHIRTGKNLQIRYENLNDKENPFITLIPRAIKEPTKIHTLFNLGWQHWMNPNSVIRTKYPKYADCSYAVNNLIKDSIRLTMQQGESDRIKKIGNYFENIGYKYGIFDS